jgi:hypothetical protein
MEYKYLPKVTSEYFYWELGKDENLVFCRSVNAPTLFRNLQKTSLTWQFSFEWAPTTRHPGTRHYPSPGDALSSSVVRYQNSYIPYNRTEEMEYKYLPKVTSEYFYQLTWGNVSTNSLVFLYIFAAYWVRVKLHSAQTHRPNPLSHPGPRFEIRWC